jgi:hypothetical protein
MVFLAGERALEVIRDGGLSPESVSVIHGAAGGPKWLPLAHLDRYLFGHWFARRQEPLYMLGASIGAWRFAAAAQSDPVSAIERFEHAYIHQFYTSKPGPGEVTRKSRGVMERYLDDAGIADILAHPFLRIAFMVARGRHLTASENRFVQLAGLIGAIAVNAASRPLLSLFFQRVLFHHPAGTPPCWPMNGFSPARVTLGPANFRDALLASGSIPMVMSGVQNIDGAPSGTYRDGGAIDYHLDIQEHLPDDRLVLFPHYTDRVIPGWLDKRFKRRGPAPERFASVLLAAPSREFVSSLPLEKIPDRNDFYRFAGDDTGRIRYWKQVVAAGARLAEDFADAVAGGGIRHRVQPYPARQAVG